MFEGETKWTSPSPEAVEDVAIVNADLDISNEKLSHEEVLKVVEKQSGVEEPIPEVQQGTLEVHKVVEVAEV